jgi:hypothetical protein
MQQCLSLPLLKPFFSSITPYIDQANHPKIRVTYRAKLT